MKTVIVIFHTIIICNRLESSRCDISYDITNVNSEIRHVVSVQTRLNEALMIKQHNDLYGESSVNWTEASLDILTTFQMYELLLYCMYESKIGRAHV